MYACVYCVLYHSILLNNLFFFFYYSYKGVNNKYSFAHLFRTIAFRVYFWTPARVLHTNNTERKKNVLIKNKNFSYEGLFSSYPRAYIILKYDIKRVLKTSALFFSLLNKCVSSRFRGHTSDMSFLKLRYKKKKIRLFSITLNRNINFFFIQNMNNLLYVIIGYWFTMRRSSSRQRLLHTLK